MSTGKAPSAGQKVAPDRNGPSQPEATGPVASDSLAAESKAFVQGNEATPQQQPSDSFTTPAESHHNTQPTSTFPSTGVAGTQNGTQNFDPAPTYVNNQYHQDRSGPHGKNLKEDDSIATEDKNKNTSFSQFGTKDDPGAAAEQKFVLADTAPVGSTGARQKGSEGKTVYDALSSETNA